MHKKTDLLRKDVRRHVWKFPVGSAQKKGTSHDRLLEYEKKKLSEIYIRE